MGFRLNLGCEKEINTIEIRNSNTEERSTKTFKVSASNSTNYDANSQVILKEREIEDFRSREVEDIPIFRFHFRNTLAQYVTFHLMDYYGDKGGGLLYFNIFQDLNEYIIQTTDFPNLSYDEKTEFMCWDITQGLRYQNFYKIFFHDEVTSWRDCLRLCAGDDLCKAWTMSFKGKCCLSNGEEIELVEGNDGAVSGLRQCKIVIISKCFF